MTLSKKKEFQAIVFIAKTLKIEIFIDNHDKAYTPVDIINDDELRHKVIKKYLQKAIIKYKEENEYNPLDDLEGLTMDDIC